MPRLLTLLALFALLAACGQKAAQAPLAPLFGTAADDAAVSVTLQKRLGHVYVAGNTGGRAFVRAYTRAGAFRWERLVTPPTGRVARAIAADVDAAGNVYLAWASGSSSADDPAPGSSIAKYSRSGGLLWRKPFANLFGMDVDTLGNLYLVGVNSVRKHDPQGRLLWERRPSSRNAPMVAVAVSARGNVVAASDNGLIVKYAGDGAQLFRTVRNFGTRGADALALGPNEEIAATSSAYTGEATIIAKELVVFSPDGVRVWKATIYDDPSGANDASSDVSFDRAGNVYLTTGNWACGSGVRPGDGFDGVVCDRGADGDPERSAVLVNKYTLTGAPVWARVFNKDRPGLDAGTGVAAFSEGELYLIGDTVNGFGTRAGGVDAFLLRLGAQGRQVWAR